MARKYNVDEVLRSLSKKSDCKVQGNTIKVLSGKGQKNDLGNKSWGKIDYLTNYCGYRQIFVSEWI